MKANKKKAVDMEKKEKENKKKAVEMEMEDEVEAKDNKKKAVELEKAEERGAFNANEDSGSAGRITKILKMLEEEIVARSDKESDTPIEKPEKPEKPCKDGMSELKKYFSGKEGVKRSQVFLKFAKLLTGDGDEAPESTAQVPQVISESKPPA